MPAAAKPRFSESVQLVILAVAAFLVFLLILWGMGYTKALNDQEYIRIVGSELSEEDFAEYLPNSDFEKTEIVEN